MSDEQLKNQDIHDDEPHDFDGNHRRQAQQGICNNHFSIAGQ